MKFSRSWELTEQQLQQQLYVRITNRRSYLVGSMTFVAERGLETISGATLLYDLAINLERSEELLITGRAAVFLRGRYINNQAVPKCSFEESFILK